MRLTNGQMAIVKNILDEFIAREHVSHFAQFVPNAVIAENEYNIAVSSYVERENMKEEISITVLNQRINEIATRQHDIVKDPEELIPVN